MLGLAILIFGALGDLFRSRVALETEILALRQQIIVLRRGKLSRLPFSASDRWILGWICRLFPNARDALAVVRPETVLRWHRAGFRVLALEIETPTGSSSGIDRDSSVDP